MRSLIVDYCSVDSVSVYRSTKVTTKSQVLASVQAVELCSEHIRKDDARRAPMRFYSTSVGVATA